MPKRGRVSDQLGAVSGLVITNHAARETSMRSIMVLLPIVLAAACGDSSTNTDSSTSASGGNGVGAGGSPVNDGGSGGGAVRPCENPEQLTQADGSPSGYERCADGTVHRFDATVPCIPPTACQGTETSLQCLTDDDCAQFGGQCIHKEWSGPDGDVSACSCAAPCQLDSDCAAGEACLCEGLAELDDPPPDGSPVRPSHCISASCAEDGDCPTGECGLSTQLTCGSSTRVSVPPVLACRQSDDHCRTDSDCPDDPFCRVVIGGTDWDCMIDCEAQH